MAQLEARLIRTCLQRTGGNKSEAARALGIDRNTLARYVRTTAQDASTDGGDA